MVNVCTSVDDIENSFFQIYPNPGNGLFTIETTKEETSILIFNLSGKIVFTALISRNDENYQSIDLRDLAPGIYQVKAISGDEVNQVKLSVY